MQHDTDRIIFPLVTFLCLAATSVTIALKVAAQPPPPGSGTVSRRSTGDGERCTEAWTARRNPTIDREFPHSSVMTTGPWTTHNLADDAHIRPAGSGNPLHSLPGFTVSDRAPPLG